MSLFRPAEKRGAIATGSPTYNPFENPAVPLASIGLDYVFGGNNSDAGVNVTAETALTLPTVFRCVGLLSTVIASCPLNVWKEPGKKKVQVPVLGTSPITTYTHYELWELVVTHLALWGNAYVLKIRDDTGKIFDLKPIHPSLVKPAYDRQTREKVFLVKHINPNGSISADKPQLFTTFEIMHIFGQGYDGLQGLSPIQLASQAIGTAISGDKLAAKFYSQGTQLGGIIKVKAPLTSNVQAEGIKARWMAAHGGVAQAGQVAVLDAETDFQPITIPPDSLQFLESRRWQTTEIARIFGIPPHLIGDVEKSTSWGTGIEQQNIGFVAYTIAGWTNRIEQRVTREVVNTRGQCAEFDLDRLMRGSTTERYQALSMAVGGPWMSVNEGRMSENKAPIDEPKYDEILPPQGIAPMPPDGQEPEGDNGNPPVQG